MREPSTQAEMSAASTGVMPYRSRYVEVTARAADAGWAFPPLPRASAPWLARREQILTLSAALQRAGWSIDDVCGLLRELDVLTQLGCDFEPRLLAYYRRVAAMEA